MWDAHSDDRWSFIKKQVFVFIGVRVSNRCRSEAVWGGFLHFKYLPKGTPERTEHVTWPILWAREKKKKKKEMQHIRSVADAERTLRTHTGLTAGEKKTINKKDNLCREPERKDVIPSVIVFLCTVVFVTWLSADIRTGQGWDPGIHMKSGQNRRRQSDSQCEERVLT